MKKVCENLKLDDKSNSENNDNSQIKRFYAGKVILLTGFTGFLGTIILEKLLRTCTEISKIYIMIREKKGVKIDERIKKYFENSIFNTLRDANPHFMEKVVPFHGDLIETDLGLSKEDRRCLVENVNIIIHNASMVYFNAKPSKILRVNVISTQKMLELGLECSRLEAFVYISTAYSNHYSKTIEENFYPPPVDLKVIKDMIQADEENDPGLSQTVIDEIVGKWTNLYAFSKATTESLVEAFSRKTSLPCIIYRPSIITTTYEEPIPGWVGNKNGPMTILILASMGVMHVAPTSEDNIVDMIPVDYTTNGLLAVIWHYVVHRQSKEPQVYNYGSSDWNPCSYKIGYKGFRLAWEEQSSSKIVWYPFMLFAHNLYAFIVLHVLLHVLPAVILDLVLIIRRKKPLAVKLLFLMGKNFNAFIRFINGTWIIRTEKLKGIQNHMNAADLKEFPFDLKTLDWIKISSLCMVAIRKSLGDPLETIPAGKRKYKRLMVLHYIVCGLFISFILFFLYRIAYIIFN